MKYLIMAVLMVVGLESALSQSSEIVVEGKVRDAVSGKGVKAKIRYTSYPTGSITGRFTDSVFSFSVFGSSKYFITAEADGYLTGTALVDPRDIGQAKSITRDIALTKKGENITLDRLIFDQGKATINPSSYPQLDEVVAMMKDNTNLIVQLEGHTESSGDPKANMKLSEDRVENVKKYLVSKGVGKDRVKTKAFGGTQPLVRGNTPEARAKNRRVEMRVLKE
ncbi:MAG: OmpA family protein [Bacteroidetes bacterium]|nr:OmpA family protein [Bacteroidota bacterium]